MDNNSSDEKKQTEILKSLKKGDSDPQTFIERISGGAEKLQEGLETKFAQHKQNSKDLKARNQQMKQVNNDVMNAERMTFGIFHESNVKSDKNFDGDDDSKPTSNVEEDSKTNKTPSVSYNSSPIKKNTSKQRFISSEEKDETISDLNSTDQTIDLDAYDNLPQLEDSIGDSVTSHSKPIEEEPPFHQFGLVRSLIYWRDVKKSGIAFGVGLLLLLGISYFSVISVFAYISLLVLSSTIALRVSKSIVQPLQKTSVGGHPFNKYLEFDLTFSPEQIQNFADVVVARIKSCSTELRRLFYIENFGDSIMFACVLYGMTYIGSWINGMILVILAFISMFTMPKIYENHKESIDTYLDLIRSNLKEFNDKIMAAISIGGNNNKKPIVVESD